MRKKPKWWALILALVILVGSGAVAYKYHNSGFGMGRWGHGGHMGGYNKSVGHMFDDWDDDNWDDDDKRGFGRMGYRGSGHMIYELSEEDMALTSDQLAKQFAEKMYGEDVVVKSLNVDEKGVLTYQLLEDDVLVQIIIIDSENKTAAFMHRK